MNQKLKTTICVFAFIPTYLLLYTLLHEGGHALVILAYGGTIDNFVLGLNAHVSAHGANFTTFGAALNHIAGMLFPTIIGAIAICFYKPKINFLSYHICYLYGSVALTFSMFAWVFIPIISLFTIPPQGDDVTKFINVVSVYPLFISLGALLLAAGFVFLASKKGVFRRIKELSSSIRKNKINRKHLLLAIGIGFLSIAVASIVVYNIAFPSVVFNTSIVTDNVLENTYRECTFKIEKDKTYSVNLTVLSQGMITAVRIMDESGELVYQDLAEDFTADFTIELQKGVYTLSLTYLADYEAIESFFENTLQGDILPEWSSYYKEILGRETNYSASFSIKIQ